MTLERTDIPLEGDHPGSLPGRITRRQALSVLGAAGVVAAEMANGRFAAPARAAADTADELGDERTAQWVMVIDLARCDGCGKCTKACQKNHYTGEQEWIPVFEIEGEAHNYYLPRPCMHCENAPCVNVCPVGATYRDPHGSILIDHNRCVGCRLCIAACPYGARSFSWDAPVNPPGATLRDYSPEFPIPHRKGTAEKCMFCAHKVKDGKLPACAEKCPMNAIWFGDLQRDLVTNGDETVSFSLLIQERSGYRLKEELGTRPRVWYLPGHGQAAEDPPPV